MRQAIADAVKVDEIVHFAGKDVADKGCSVVPNGYLGEDCSAGTYRYDVAQARKLLAQAGFPNGITIKSIVSNISEQQPIMEIVQAQLAKAGIKLEMEIVDHPTYQAKSRQNLSALVFYGAARFPTADSYLTEFYDSAASVGSPTAMSNFSHCSAADGDIRAARVEPDPGKQLALWKDAQAKIRFAKDQLAGKEMQVGRYYLERKEYLAAVTRFRTVVEKYPTTNQIEEALARLVEAYFAMGVVGEAQTAAAVLGNNYPDSQWYADSYKLLQTGGLEPRENKGSWISRAGKSLLGV